MATVELSAELTRLAVAMKTDLKAKRVNVLTKCMFGLYKTFTASPASAQTFMTQCELESDFYGVRIGVPNINSAAVTGVKVSVTAFAQFAYAPDAGTNYIIDASPSGNNGWHDCTFNGAATATLPAAIATNVASITYFDFVGLHSIARTNASNATTRPLIAIKIEYPSGAVVTVPYNDVYSWRTEGGIHRPMRNSYQAVAGVTTPSAFTQDHTQDTNVVVPIIQYFSKQAGLQVMCSGDSTTEGTGGECRAFGAIPVACGQLSTPTAPVEYYNAGMHGCNPLDYGTGAINYIDFVKPQILFYQPWSINNTAAGNPGGTIPSQMELDYMYMTRVSLLAQRLNTKLVFLPGLPVGTAFKTVGAGDSIRRQFNTEMAAMTGVTVVPGYESAIAGAQDSAGQVGVIDGSTTDGAHPTAASYTTMASKITPFLTAV